MKNYFAEEEKLIKKISDAFAEEDRKRNIVVDFEMSEVAAKRLQKMWDEKDPELMKLCNEMRIIKVETRLKGADNGSKKGT